MGNSASSSGRGHHDESVDYGHLTPQGVYTGPRDWNHPIVAQLICTRRLAPFYRPLEEYDECWDDDQVLAARKVLPDQDGESVTPRNEINNASISRAKRPGMAKEPSKPEASIYRGAVECPICFLYYPPNINHSRCCDQAICTECFVQIKRSEPTTTHLVSEPAACPYCVQDNFGIVYTPPPWRAGIGSHGDGQSDSPKGSLHSIESSSFPTHKRRQKSFGADSPEVVTTDQIRPDWEAKLAAVRATVTRRANRSIIMRQVGDRFIPVGVTSGRVHPITPEDGSDSNDSSGGSRRSRRRQQNGDLNHLLGGLGGQDLEDLMVMEAMRLSLIDQEEAQRREAQNRNGTVGTSTEPETIDSSPSDHDASRDQSSNQLLNSNEPSPSTSAPVSSSASSLPYSHEASSEVSSQNISTSSAVNHITTLQGVTDSTSWRHQTSGPPFSTLTAAMSAASTVSAVLGGDNNTTSATSTVLSPMNQSSSHNNAVQNITIAVPTVLHRTDAPPSLQSAISPAQESSASSFMSTEDEHAERSSYDFLPSSPESTVSHERLLPEAETE